jgi:hypothetical protein
MMHQKNYSDSKYGIISDMKNLNMKKCISAVVSFASFATLFAQEILIVSTSDVSIYEEGTSSVEFGAQTWRWSAAEDSAIPSSLKKNFVTYSDAKPFAGGKEIILTSCEGGWAIVDRAKKTARAWGVCGTEAFSIEMIGEDIVAVSGKDDKSRSGCVFLFDLKNEGKKARFVFDKPRGLYWDKDRSLLWVLDAGALSGCKLSRDKEGVFSLNRYKIISLVDRDTGLGCDLRPMPASTNTLLSATMKGVIRFVNLKKMSWHINSSTIPVDAVNSYDANIKGKSFFVRKRSDGSESDMLEKRMWGRRFAPFKKIKGASIRRARWVQ